MLDGGSFSKSSSYVGLNSRVGRCRLVATCVSSSYPSIVLKSHSPLPLSHSSCKFCSCDPETQPLVENIKMSARVKGVCAKRHGGEKRDGNKKDLPVLPGPASMILNLDPSTESEFAFCDLDFFLTADAVFAACPIVAGKFCASSVLAATERTRLVAEWRKIILVVCGKGECGLPTRY